ncbi:TetR/AcrR family transcriptional regulator [Frankia sp. AgPm24]|uniref:TetR/AcrR family transcriptional regulator n=1 Tax=Frankia sp. AgPm24 TaxID=631128 RepID=UPI00200CB924|nr:TetR/AcrR family transcriptional regulator [Frankia sp. AgPm24]MCK9925334.1 TetR/AcrR family transcriptional regulator [Frankia sp. AgPm24]
MDTAASSLRERSKARRRHSIQRAAIRLFAEHGYDGTTIADIAEAAEVAPRTVSMYFPNKIDIAMSASNDMSARLTATFRANPRLPFTDVIDLWLVDVVESLDVDLAVSMAAMFDTNPPLRAVSTAHIMEATGLSTPALVAQLGLAADDPLIAIVYAAVSSAITEYIASVLTSGGTRVMHDQFVRYLRAVIGAARPG